MRSRKWCIIYLMRDKKEQSMTTITLQTTPQQDKLITQFLEEHQELKQQVLNFILERLEDEEDSKLADQAYAAYQQDPETYSLSEMRKRHGL